MREQDCMMASGELLPLQIETVLTPESEPNPELVRMFDYPSFPDDQEITPEERDQLKALLGGKGLSLAEMTQKRLPVPYGFTVTTEAGRLVSGNNDEIPEQLWNKEIIKGLSLLEEKTGKKFGDRDNPLICSGRSGAKVSMPGMMDTILNLGITDETLDGFKKQVGELCALDCYQRLIRMYSVAVYEIEHTKFRIVEEEIKKRYRENTVEFYQQLVDSFKKTVSFERGYEFEQNPHEQLRRGIEAIFKSAMSLSAIDYRNSRGLPHDMYTAVNVQAMVFGNTGPDSGTAVVYTHDLQTGEKKLGGHFLHNAQGEAVVAGLAHPLPINELPLSILDQLKLYRPIIEKMFQGAVDIEITWENGKLHILQSRSLKTSPLAAMTIAADLITRDIITPEEAIQQITVDQIMAVKKPKFKDEDLEEARRPNRLLTKGMPVSGIGVGKICLDSERARELIAQGENIIFICDHFDPNNVWLVKNTQAVVTLLGAPSSHMGLIMNEAGCAGSMGCSEIKINQEARTVTIDRKTCSEGTTISVNGYTGEIFLGEIPIATAPVLSEKTLRIVKDWEKVYGENNPWAAFLFPTEKEDLDHVVRKDDCEKAYKQAQMDWPGLDKAQQVAVLENVLPRSIKIPETIIRIPEDGLDEATRDKTKQAILEAKKQGYSIWLRSDNSELLSPYGKTDLGKEVNEAALEDWLTNPDSNHSKWGGLPKWVDKHGIKAIIIPFDPPDKLNSEFRHQHFVCTVRCLNASPPEVVVEIHDQNIHLRSLEETSEDKLMQIVAKASLQSPNGLGQINYRFGAEHFDDEKLEVLTAQLQQTTADAKVQALKRKAIRMFDSDCLKNLTESRLKKILQSLADKNLLNQMDYSLLINQRSLEVINFVNQNVFEDWWQNHALPHLMWSMKETTDAWVLEIQGRYNPEGESWMLVY